MSKVSVLALKSARKNLDKQTKNNRVGAFRMVKRVLILSIVAGIGLFSLFVSMHVVEKACQRDCRSDI